MSGFSLNGKRAIMGLVTFSSGALFCQLYARPEYVAITTFIWCVSSAMSTLVQWVVNGSHTE